jgi:hypothetical protein
MRLRTLQITAALAAIVAFVLAFVVAGIALVSGAFMRSPGWPGASSNRFTGARIDTPLEFDGLMA